MVQTSGAQEIKVTLLGTRTPVPAMNRFGPSILVEAGGQTFLFDAGHGAMQRLTQLRVRWQGVDGLPDTPSFGSRGWLSGSLVDRLARRLGPRQATPCLTLKGPIFSSTRWPHPNHLNGRESAPSAPSR